MPDFKLPDVGEGLTEAEIVSWKVQVGDEVDVNDVLVEIETAKSLVELPSPYAGAVTAILVAEGEVVAVGTSIITVGTEQNVSDGQRAEPVDSAPAGAFPPTPQRPSRCRRPWSDTARVLASALALGADAHGGSPPVLLRLPSQQRRTLQPVPDHWPSRLCASSPKTWASTWPR